MHRPVVPFARWTTVRPLVLVVLLFSSAHAGADELIMRDGSRLLGTVVKREGATLSFKTAYAGVINVQWDQIARVTTEKPMEILLSDDTIVPATRLSNEAGGLVVESAPGAAPQTIDPAAVAVINPEPWRKGKGAKLSGHANFAFLRQRGNTDKDQTDLDADLTLRRRHDRFKAFGEVEVDKIDNQTTTSKWKAEGEYNYFVSKKWYWGGFVRFEHDKFADLDLRTSVGPLVGYQWFESKEMNLSTSTGISYVNQDYINESDDDYAALPWNINFDKYLLHDMMQFYHRQVGFWNLSDTANVVWNTWTGVRFPLVLGLVASTEIKVEYDSGAAKGTDKTDTTYNLKLGYQW